MENKADAQRNILDRYQRYFEAAQDRYREAESPESREFYKADIERYRRKAYNLMQELRMYAGER